MDRRYFLQLVGAATGIGAFPGIVKAAITGQVSRPIIKIVGVGGAGGNIVTQLHKEGIKGLTETICIDTDESAMVNLLADRKIVIGSGERLTKRHPTEAHKIAFSHREAIKSAVAGSDIVVVVAGLGGMTGTCMAASVISHARQAKACVIAVLVMPFLFEGNNRHWEDGLLIAQNAAHFVITISNAAIADSLGEDAPQLDVFAASDRAVLNTIETVLHMTGSGATFLQNSMSAVDQASVVAFCQLAEKEIVSKLPHLQEMLDEAHACTNQLNELDTGLAQAYELRLQPADRNGIKDEATADSWKLNLQRTKLLRRLRVLYETLDYNSEDTKALLANLAWVGNHHQVAVTLPLTKINDLLAAVDEKVKVLGQENSPVYGLVL